MYDALVRKGFLPGPDAIPGSATDKATNPKHMEGLGRATNE